MPISVVDGPTIAAGQSLSDVADCSAGKIVRITVPAEYVTSTMTFQISSDGAFFNDMYDASGREVRMVAKADTTVVIVDPELARSAAFVKIRSGTRRFPVPQTVNCKLAIAIETP